MSTTLHPARLITALLATALISVVTTNASGQLTAVSPREFIDTEMPGVANVLATPSYRLQQVYSKLDFEHLGEGPYTITRIDWRPDLSMDPTIDYPSENFLMNFATTLADPAANANPLDPAFANNIAGNLKTVFDGPVTLTTANDGPINGPKEFDYGLDFETPYIYDPADGNLLMDLFVTNGEGPLLLDWMVEPTDTTGFIWSGDQGIDSEIAAAGQFGGHALQFSVVPEPAAFPLLLMGGFASLGLVRTRRSTRSAT